MSKINNELLIKMLRKLAETLTQKDCMEEAMQIVSVADAQNGRKKGKGG